MKKTYTAPSAESIAFDTEEILKISFTGFGTILDEGDNNSSKSPATDFGNVSLF